VESEGVNVGKCPCPSGCCTGIFAVQRFLEILTRKELCIHLAPGGFDFFQKMYNILVAVKTSDFEFHPA